MVSVLDTAIVRPGATVLPMAQGGLTLPYVDDSDHSSAVLGGISFSWYAEGEAITASSPLFGRLRFEPWKAAALLDAIPNELLSDGADAMGAFLRLVIPGAYAQAEDSKFLWGTGTAEPEGATECSCVISVTRDTSSHITAVDIAAMLARMLPYSLGRAVWVASNDTLPDLLALSTAIGTPADTATGTTGWLTWGPDGPRLLGKPVYFTERAPKLGTAGDLTLIDRQFYAIGDRLEMRLDHSGLGDGFPHDESQYRVTARVDGHCWCRTPLTPANGGSTVSPVVVLS
jgi:HK97 family phage major capsid protein